MKKYFSVLALFVACFVAGYSYLRLNTEDYGINRNPAAVNSSFDFSHLQGEKLAEAVKKRLLSAVEVRKNELGTGISFGHFVFGEAGQKKLACQEFSKVVMVFEADGVSVSGDRPQMEVEGQCDYSHDMGRINPVYVPVSKILNEHPGDGEFQFIGDSSTVTTIRFTNLPDSWPRLWLLKTVKLFNDKTAQSFIVGSDEVSKYLGHPVVMSWQ